MNVGNSGGTRRELRQGDWIKDVESLALLLSDGTVTHFPIAHGAVIVTQCCDLTQNKTDRIHLAPVIELDGDEERFALSGRVSRYGPLSSLPNGLYVDLSTIATAERNLVHGEMEIVSLKEARSRRDFAATIARRYSRFAYPDFLHPYLSPLRDEVRRKSRKANSPLGAVIRRIATLRLEVQPDWYSESDIQVRLLVVVDPSFLPSQLEPHDASKELVEWLSDERSISDIAARILDSDVYHADIGPLWESLGDSLLTLLERGKEDASRPVTEIDVEVMNTHELTYARWLASTDLDLDDLSPFEAS